MKNYFQDHYSKFAFLNFLFSFSSIRECLFRILSKYFLVRISFSSSVVVFFLHFFLLSLHFYLLWFFNYLRLPYEVPTNNEQKKIVIVNENISFLTCLNKKIIWIIYNEVWSKYLKKDNLIYFIKIRPSKLGTISIYKTYILYTIYYIYYIGFVIAHNL